MDKQRRALVRECEALHDEIEERLAGLIAQREAVLERIGKDRAELQDIEAQMDELKGPLHAKRLELAALVNGTEEPK